MHYDYSHERDISLLVAPEVLQGLAHCRELILPNGDPPNLDRLHPPGSILLGYGTSGKFARVWFAYTRDLDSDTPSAGIGKLCDPNTVGNIGRPAGAPRKLRRHKRSSINALTGQVSLLKSLLRRLFRC